MDMNDRQFSIGNCQLSIVNLFPLIVSLVLYASVVQAAPLERLPIIQKAPDFDLVDQSGKAVRLTDFKGKVMLVSFIFTTCNGTCPATTSRMAKIQEHLQQRSLLEKGVRLVSISLDPKRDTPEVLRGYMRLYEADASTGQLDHPSRIFLVDRKGQIREIYNLDFLRVPWVTEDVELLLREKS